MLTKENIRLSGTTSSNKLQLTGSLAIVGQTEILSSFCSLLVSSPGWKFFDELWNIISSFCSFTVLLFRQKIHWIPCHRQCVNVTATLKHTVRQLISFFILTLFCGCFSFDRKQEVFKTDEDFIEFWRQPSSDSSMLLLNYGIDLGAFGYGQAGTAILKLADTAKNLRLFTLPNTFDRLKWIDNKTISAQFDTIPFVRHGKPSTFRDTIINDINPHCSYPDSNSRRCWVSIFLSSTLCTTDFRFLNGL